jgi:uncharacterized protein (DUF427 family)
MGIHDITIAPVGGTVRVALGGELVAQSDRALVLDEAGLPPRYYLPREDVRAELLPSDHRTWCPFKGSAGYHSIGEHENVVWFYADPKKRVAAIRDHVAFYGERAEITVT